MARQALAAATILSTSLLLAAPAGAQFYGKNKVQTHALAWRVLTTPHFDLHFHDGAEELAVRAAIIAERAYKEYAERLDRDLPFRVPFILYSSHADFSQTNIAPYLIGEGTGGFSEPFRNRIVTVAYEDERPVAFGAMVWIPMRLADGAPDVRVRGPTRSRRMGSVRMRTPSISMRNRPSGVDSTRDSRPASG